MCVESFIECLCNCLMSSYSHLISELNGAEFYIFIYSFYVTTFLCTIMSLNYGSHFLASKLAHRTP